MMGRKLLFGTTDTWEIQENLNIGQRPKVGTPGTTVIIFILLFQMLLFLYNQTGKTQRQVYFKDNQTI